MKNNELAEKHLGKFFPFGEKAGRELSTYKWLNISILNVHVNVQCTNGQVTLKRYSVTDMSGHHITSDLSFSEIY